MHETTHGNSTESSTKSKRAYADAKTSTDIVCSTKAARLYFQELGTHLHMKLVEDSLSALSFGRLGDELETLGNHEETSKSQRQRDSICQARTRQWKPIASYRSGGHHAKIAPAFLSKFDRRRRSIGQENTSSSKKKESWGDPFAQAEPPSVVTDAGDDPYAEDK